MHRSRLFAAVAVLSACPLLAQVRVDVLTQHNDFDRSGHNARETLLTPDAVKKSFGKLFDAEVDAQVYAQPLIVSGLTMKGKTRNVLIVATMNNTVYQFDADTGETLWSKNYGPAARTPNAFWPSLARWGYRDVSPLVGIVSTPVIDRATNTLYFTSYTERPPTRAETPPNWQQWVNAIDLTSHADKMGSPVEVTYTIEIPEGEMGSAADSKLPHDAPVQVHARTGASPIIGFDPGLQMQRPGLLLVNGRLVLGFASHGDFGDYHGWVFSYDAANLQSAPGVWNSTLDINADRGTVRGGIWQSGMGLTTDAAGNVYLMTGNGDYDPGDQNWGDSVVKLALSGGKVDRADSFTPCDQEALDRADIDLGSSGVLHPPGSQYIIGGGKEGVLYVLDTAKLGGQNTSGGIDVGCINPQIRQQVQVSCPSHEVTPPQACGGAGQADTGHIHGAPVYFESRKNGATIYVWCEDDHLRALTWKNSMLSPTTCQTASWPSWAISKAISPAGLQHGMTGGMLSISSNAGAGGVVWAATPTNNNANQQIIPGILYAYDADNLQNELWNSYLSRDRDDFGNYSKFTPPTIANGKVYVPTFSNHVSVYGLNPPAPPAAVTNLLVNGGFENGSTGWTFSSPSGSVTACYPYYGKGAAQLAVNMTGPVTVSQTVTAPSTGDYHLSAYALTTFVSQFLSPGTTGGLLGVTVGLLAVGTQGVSSYTGYLEYGFDFSATAGQTINVWYSAPVMPRDYPKAFRTNSWSNLDEVVLTKK